MEAKALNLEVGVNNSKAEVQNLVTDALIADIEADFLSAWPGEFHEDIKKLEKYKKYFSFLRGRKELILYKEHGDFTTNNILAVEDKLYLTDFEFAKSFQPVYLDYYDFAGQRILIRAL